MYEVIKNIGLIQAKDSDETFHDCFLQFTESDGTEMMRYSTNFLFVDSQGEYSGSSMLCSNELSIKLIGVLADGKKHVIFNGLTEAILTERRYNTIRNGK